MRNRVAVASLSLAGALVIGPIVGTHSDPEGSGRMHWWVSALWYAMLALLAVFVLVVLTGLFGLVRRTFKDTRRGSYT
jgi:hypothetical protein